MQDLPNAAVPFVLQREHGVIRSGEVMSTEERLYGLLRLYGDDLFIQWRTARSVSRVGREIRIDHELEPIREVTLPVSGIAGATLGRVWRRWWLRRVLVITAADLRTFDPLVGQDGVPGLVLEHPAEIVLELRRADVERARDFVSQIGLSISEEMLRALRDSEHRQDLEETPRLAAGGDEETLEVEGGIHRREATRQRSR